jgi:hypothetical protein
LDAANFIKIWTTIGFSGSILFHALCSLHS